MRNCNILFRHLQKNHQYNHQFCRSFFSVFRSYYPKITAVLVSYFDWTAYIHWRASVTHYNSSFEEKSIRYSWFQTFALFWMFYAFFWAIPRLLNFICRRFGTLCSILYRKRFGSKQTFSLINTPTFFKPSHSSHLPAY